MISKMNYNFHDAVVINCPQSEDNKLVMTVKLYKTTNPLEEELMLTFSDVFNVIKLQEFKKELNDDVIENEWNGTRINSIQYDNNKKSKSNNLYFYLDFDGIKPMRIHCQKFLIEV